MFKPVVFTAILIVSATSTPLLAVENSETQPRILAQKSLPAAASEPALEVKKLAKAPEVKVKAVTSVQTDLRYHTYPSDTLFTKDDQRISDVRRARVDVTGEVGATYNGKFSADFTGSTPLREAYINYKFFKPAQIVVGQFFPPFGNEAQGSSMAQEFIEDSGAANANNLGVDRGIVLHGELYNGRFAYGAGFVNGAAENVADNNNSMDFVLRTVIASPKDNYIKYWLGFSFNTGEQTAAAGDSIRYATETASGTTLFKATWPTGQTYTRTRYGFDVTTLLGPGMLKLEYLFADFDFTRLAALSGGNLMGSYFLTGEQRAVKNSFFTSQSVASPVNVETGDFGAIELAMRYSWFNADSEFFTTNGLFDGWGAVSASQYTDSGYALTAGLNWYLEQGVRVMFNWVNTFAAKAKTNTPDQGDKKALIEQSYLVRFQLAL